MLSLRINDSSVSSEWVSESDYRIGRHFSEDLILALLATIFCSLKLCIANNTSRLGNNVVYYIVNQSTVSTAKRLASLFIYENKWSVLKLDENKYCRPQKIGNKYSDST